MSLIQDSEQDLELKLRIMRYLWGLGYFVRRNIAILEQQPVGKQYTDIDVLAVKVDAELNTRFLVCDCKSGTQARTRERFFWLAGVMKFFGVAEGLFIRSKLFERKYAELANKLGITPLSEEQLGELETSYQVDTNSFIGPFSKESGESEKILSLLRQFAPESSDYLRSFYWGDPPAEQITNLVACCNRIKDVREIDVKAKNFLLAYCLSLLTLSVVRFSKNVIVLPEASKGEFVRVELLGGAVEHETRQALLKGFYDFMYKEIEHRYNSKYPISRSQFLESLTPGYSKYLIDFVVRLCKNPSFYVMLPRLFDLIAYEVILGKRSLNIQNLIQSATYLNPDAIVKPMTDFVAMAERSGLLTLEMTKLLKEQIGLMSQ